MHIVRIGKRYVNLDNPPDGETHRITLGPEDAARVRRALEALASPWPRWRVIGWPDETEGGESPDRP